MKKYIAIIGDLIDSKNITNRLSFQKDIKEILNIINEKYDKYIVSNFTLTLGDEFQAILEISSMIPRILDDLYISIDHDFRLGIGIGEIITDINPLLSIGSDGEAFWNARSRIEYVYTNNYNKKANVYFKGSSVKKDDLINTIFILTENLKNTWTKKQKDTFSLMLKNDIYDENFNQKEFSKLINISESSLSKRLISGNIKQYLHGRKTLQRLLEDYYELF